MNKILLLILSIFLLYSCEIITGEDDYGNPAIHHVYDSNYEFIQGIEYTFYSSNNSSWSVNDRVLPGGDLDYIFSSPGEFNIKSHYRDKEDVLTVNVTDKVVKQFNLENISSFTNNDINRYVRVLGDSVAILDGNTIHYSRDGGKTFKIITPTGEGLINDIVLIENSYNELIVVHGNSVKQYIPETNSFIEPTNSYVGHGRLYYKNSKLYSVETSYNRSYVSVFDTAGDLISSIGSSESFKTESVAPVYFDENGLLNIIGQGTLYTITVDTADNSVGLTPSTTLNGPGFTAPVPYQSAILIAVNNSLTIKDTGEDRYYRRDKYGWKEIDLDINTIFDNGIDKISIEVTNFYRFLVINSIKYSIPLYAVNLDLEMLNSNTLIGITEGSEEHKKNISVLKILP